MIKKHIFYFLISTLLISLPLNNSLMGFNSHNDYYKYSLEKDIFLLIINIYNAISDTKRNND